MKPPAWRLDPAIYPHVCQIQTRYTDEDMLRHVNNIAVAGYYDEARSRFSRAIFNATNAASGESLGAAHGRGRIVTADSRVSYLAEVFHRDDETVEIRTGILRIGTSSYEIGQALIQGGRCAGLCTTVFVQADASGSSPLSPALRAVLEAQMIKAPPQD
ncbi:acyl-CoA thioesterase [Novosphingobium olei]|uniref:Acyl-CoA thioesterase n=1 Tax=Novosphingobium olei TaxID=2728851 RepID=A0A7Y0BRP9_9SPHN|nr:acyl-CoA thioesterase [Novosphingobium olei]NML95173.1 acyl-CoA thioesterase [Novosphingobium olei]